MKWLLSLALMATAFSGVQLQCLSQNDDFVNATYSTDLSSITDFGLELYKQLSPAQSKDNFFFSPYSIWSALTLAYLGSAGNTQRQLESKLGVSDKVSTAKKRIDLANLYKRRQVNNSLYTFDLANRAYFDKTLNVRPCMQQILREEMRILNFIDTTGSATDINKFVSETTRGRISELVQPDDLKNALMVLVNAVFFKGTWKYQFNSSATSQKPFFINAQDSAPLPMMSQRGKFKYGESRQLGARVLELPYSGEVMSMFLLLPDPSLPVESRFTNMVRNLNGQTLQQAINPSNLSINLVDVQLPRFKFEKELRDELKLALINMGIVDLFDPRLSDLSGFEPNVRLRISKAIHKAFVEVNEEGTEAAAVTALLTDRIGGVPDEPKVIEFHCNQPFIFLIHDNQTKNVLFLGAIKNPSF